MSRRAWVALALAVAWGAPAAGAEAEEMSLRASSSADTVDFPGTRELTSRLEVEAGSEARRFQVRVNSNWKFGQEQGPDRAEGAPIVISYPALDGDLESEGGGGEIPYVVCSPYKAVHGDEPNAWIFNVYVPAGGRGGITVRLRPSTTAPWPTTDYRPVFKVSPKQRDFFPVPSPKPAPGAVPTVDVLPPPLRVTGRRGVQIFFDTDPATGSNIFQSDWPEHPPDAILGIHGHTDPPLRRQKLDLHYVVHPDRALQHLAFVRTDADGRFRLRAWRPHRAGNYELWPHYYSQSPGMADDFACPREFKIASASDPAPELRLDATKVRVAGGKVGVPARCIGAPPARCRGSLRLAGRRWRRSVAYDWEAPSAGVLEVGVPRAHGKSALAKARAAGPARPTPPRRIRILPPKR